MSTYVRTLVGAYEDELEKIAWEFNGKHLGALSLAAIMAGTGLGKMKADAHGWQNVPAYAAAKVQGKPFDPWAAQAARDAVTHIYRPPPVLHADNGPKLLRMMGKKASVGALGHATELAGLGVLAKPSIDRLRGKEVDERKASKYEVAGLGILAAPSAISLAHSAYKHLKPKLRGVG